MRSPQSTPSEIIPNVKAFEFINRLKGTWIIYYTMDSNLVLYDMESKSVETFKSIIFHKVNEEGKILVTQAVEKTTPHNATTYLVATNLQSKLSDTVIKTSFTLRNIVLDKVGEQIAFTIGDQNNMQNDIISVYNTKTKLTQRLVDKETPGMCKNCTIGTWSRVFGFSKDGDKFFLP